MADCGMQGLLSDFELSILAELDVDIQPVGMTFQRELSAQEMRAVGWLLVSLRKRADENSLMEFALGDWMVKADQWFGEDTGIRWIQEVAMLVAFKDHLLGLTGATLIELQSFERFIATCCALLQLKTKKGEPVVPSDFLSNDSKRRTKCLGPLKDALVKAGIFDPSFESRLANFVKSRNQFIHSFWLEKFQEVSYTNPPTLETLKEVEQFASGLLKEAVGLEAPFRGLCYSIGKRLAERRAGITDLSNHLFVEWSKYEKDFLSVVRQRGNEDQQRPS
ncbi:MAG: hypothetical protein AABN33_19450 [Acidobacteriota bacterium]